jgi:hypothetical protein
MRDRDGYPAHDDTRAGTSAGGAELRWYCRQIPANGLYWQQIEQCTLVLVGLVLSLPHAKNTLDTYGPIGPDRDESTRAAFDAVITARPEHRRTALRQSSNGAGHDPSSGQTS